MIPDDMLPPTERDDQSVGSDSEQDESTNELNFNPNRPTTRTTYDKEEANSSDGEQES